MSHRPGRKVATVVEVRWILGDLRSGVQKFGYREILGPVTLSNAKNISGDLSGALKFTGIPLLRFYTLTTGW